MSKKPGLAAYRASLTVVEIPAEFRITERTPRKKVSALAHDAGTLCNNIAQAIVPDEMPRRSKNASFYASTGAALVSLAGEISGSGGRAATWGNLDTEEYYLRMREIATSASLLAWRVAQDAKWLERYGLYDPRGDLWGAVQSAIGVNMRGFKQVLSRWHRGRLFWERQNRNEDLAKRVVEGIAP